MPADPEKGTSKEEKYLGIKEGVANRKGESSRILMNGDIEWVRVSRK